MEEPAASLFYPHSPSSSTFSLFPNNPLYQPTEPTSSPPRTQELQHQHPRSMMYASLGYYNPSNFHAVNSPGSSPGSASLTNSDESTTQSPADYIPADDHPSTFEYGHDLFDQLKSMFTPPATDSLPRSSDSIAEMNHHHFIIKQEPLYDSYQPYIDTCNGSLSPYHTSPHLHTVDTHIEHFSSASMTTPSLTYGFSAGAHDSTGPPPATSSSGEPIDLIGSSDYSFSAMRYSALSPQCLHPEELSPSPRTYTVAPDPQGCDPRFVAGNEDDGRLSEVAVQIESGRKRKRRNSLSSAISVAHAASPPTTYTGSQSLSDEEQEQDAMDDGEYEDSGGSEAEVDREDDTFRPKPSPRSRSTWSIKTRRGSSLGLSPLSLGDSSSSFGGLDDEASATAGSTRRTRGFTAPVPVPNLTKKSRGRRVPTASAIVSQGGVQMNPRTYMCKVKDCGKCFARGEHLKRHVRSIHTNEKPHRCPFPGCNKDFSRHDNLGQHMRVHKNYSAPKNPAR